MSKVRTLLTITTIIVAGFLIFTATRYVDILNHLSYQQPVSGICAGLNGGGGCYSSVRAIPVPWEMLGWLIFLSIVFVDLLIANVYFFIKRKRPNPPPENVT